MATDQTDKPPSQTLAEWAETSTPRIWPQDLARIAGIHVATAYRLMDGHCWPTLKTAIAIWKASGGRVALWDITDYTTPNGKDE